MYTRKARRVPRVEVEGAGAFGQEGKRLVLAIEEYAGVDILHRCGAYAGCATCRVEFLEGEPERMTRAELEVLEFRDLLRRVRLSCGVVCDQDDVRVRPLVTVASTGPAGPGAKPEPGITTRPSGWRGPPGGRRLSGSSVRPPWRTSRPARGRRRRAAGRL